MAQALAPKTDMAGNTGIAAMAPQAAPAPVQRMQEGGEIEDVPSIAEILAGAQENQSRAMLGPFETQYRRYLDQQVDSLPSGVEAFDPRMTPEMRRTMRAMPEVSDAPTGLDDARPRIEGTTPARPFGAYADLLDAPTTAEQVFGDLPPIQGPPQQPRGEAERPNTSRFEAATLGLGADQEFAEPPTGRGYFPRTEDILQGIATGATFGGAALPLVNPDMAYDVGTSVFGEEPFRRAGIIDPARRRLAEQFEEEAEAADRARGPSDETRELAEQFEEEAEAADREIADLPGGVAPDLGIETPAAPDGGGGGGAGGGGSRTGTLGDVDRMYEQDKWLSLARFGLGLMASSQPTLGGAIGEAGGAALDSLGQAREDLLQRRMAEAQLARRGGGGGGRDGGLDRGDLALFDAQIESLEAQLSNSLLELTPAQRLDLNQQLTSLRNQRAALNRAYLAQLGPGMLEYLDAAGAPPTVEEEVIEARPGFLERVFGG
jgi:hypothetical protein